MFWPGGLFALFLSSIWPFLIRVFVSEEGTPLPAGAISGFSARWVGVRCKVVPLGPLSVNSFHVDPVGPLLLGPGCCLMRLRVYGTRNTACVAVHDRFYTFTHSHAHTCARTHTRFHTWFLLRARCNPAWWKTGSSDHTFFQLLLGCGSFHSLFLHG